MSQAVVFIAALFASVTFSIANAAETDDRGRQLFVKEAMPPCAVCHTLADAGASGAVGPSLDELKPDADRVLKAVKAGFGQMPAFPQLSDEQLQTLARYVARASGALK
ncbi:MAG: cytochrome c [Burkholderiaceae bacterium]